MDDQAGLRLPGPAPRRGRQRGLRRALEGAPGPGRRAGAAAGAAGALRSVRHAHRSRHGRGGPRRPSPPGQRQALQALCLECHRSKTFLESSHATSLESRFCRHVHETYACSPRLPPLVCGLRSRQGLSGRGRRPLPQERPGQRTLSPAGLLSPGQHPARRGRTPGGPDLRAQEGGPARGPGRAAPLRRPGLVRQARDGLHA